MQGFRAAITMVLVMLPLTAVAEEADPGPFTRLFTEGEVDLDFRYRYEFVDQECCDPTEPAGTDFDDDAHALTLRSRLSYRSGTWRNFGFFAEAEDVRSTFVNDFNAGAGDTVSRENYPQVNDPEVTQVNQAYVDYTGVERLRLRLGRQRINFDNQRFVGGVIWRQNEQTYDAVSAAYDHERFDAFYGYVRKVQRLFSDDVAAGDHKQNGTHLLNVSGQLSDWGKLSGYVYHIDNQDEELFSTSTFGARFIGSRPLENVSIRYALEYAYQEDAGDNPTSYDADYFLADFGVIVDALDVGVGYELLSGAEDGRFVTPLSTLHAHDGWADKFLFGGTGNPPGGLEDRFLKVKFTFGDYVLEGRYHDFDSDDLGDDLGQELNLSLERPLGEYVRMLIKYADFDGEGEFSATDLSDTRKFWLQFTVTF